LPGIEVAPEVRPEVRCHRCDAQFFAVARAVGLYEGALRETVLALKRQPYLSTGMIELLVAAASRAPFSAGTATSTKLIPVPLHQNRQRERGFNQAVVIAAALAKALRLPLDEVSLTRVRGSDKYRAGLDPKGRRDTVARAFAVRHPRMVEDENILLVDDVFTTGATVDACAEVLLASGARQVLVLTIARGKS
jgi:ComF family protein